MKELSKGLFEVENYSELSEFVTESHYNRCRGKEWRIHNPYTLIFRACGAASLRRLREGAGAKPHDILEKSVKASSAEPDYLKGFVGHWSADKLLGVYAATGWQNVARTNNYMDIGGIKINGRRFQLHGDHFGMTLEDFCAVLTTISVDVSRGLFAYAVQGARQKDKVICSDTHKVANGFIGKWKKDLLGICMTDHGKRVLNAEYGDYIQPVGARWYFALPDQNARNVFAELIRNGGTKYFFAGDYDLMDHIEGNHYLIEGTYEHELFMEKVQEMFPPVHLLHSAEAKDYRLIQHGAQFGFVAYILNNEIREIHGKPGKLFETVASIEFPLAALSKDQWYLIADINGYKAFFESLGLKPKERWMDESKSTYDYLLEISKKFGSRLLCFDAQGNVIPLAF